MPKRSYHRLTSSQLEEQFRAMPLSDRRAENKGRLHKFIDLKLCRDKDILLQAEEAYWCAHAHRS